jgi:hypothetical protein
MLTKHKGQSELFARSMAFNIADSLAQSENSNINLNQSSPIKHKLLHIIKKVVHMSKSGS